APCADIEPARALDDLEHRPRIPQVVLVALRALEQRVGVELTAMQERNVAGVDAALHGLQPVAFLQALPGEAVRARYEGKLPFRQWRLVRGWPHVGPQHAAALDERVGLELDPGAEAALFRLGGNLHALAGVIVFPPVVGTAQTAVLIAPEPERHAA